MEKKELYMYFKLGNCFNLPCLDFVGEDRRGGQRKEKMEISLQFSPLLSTFNFNTNSDFFFFFCVLITCC